MIEFMHNGHSFLVRDDNYSRQWIGQGKTKTLAREDLYATIAKYDLRPCKVQLHGRTYAVTKTFKTVGETNAYLEEHPDEGVLVEDCLIYIVNLNDEGKP
jgi:hypothetical protein